MIRYIISILLRAAAPHLSRYLSLNSFPQVIERRKKEGVGLTIRGEGAIFAGPDRPGDEDGKTLEQQLFESVDGEFYVVFRLLPYHAAPAALSARQFCGR